MANNASKAATPDVGKTVPPLMHSLRSDVNAQMAHCFMQLERRPTTIAPAHAPYGPTAADGRTVGHD
jgi:hypothetical protein